jgi:hypothetical protein
MPTTTEQDEPGGVSWTSASARSDDIVVDVKADPISVERDGGVDVPDRQTDHFEFQVHGFLKSCGSTTSHPVLDGAVSAISLGDDSGDEHRSVERSVASATYGFVVSSAVGWPRSLPASSSSTSTRTCRSSSARPRWRWAPPS